MAEARSDYEKVSKMAKDVLLLGNKKTKFFKWKRDIEDITEDFNLTEKEKKRIILSTTTGNIHDLC